MATDLPRRFAGAPLALAAPSSIAERWDIAVAITRSAEGGQSTTHRVLAGALGLCWSRVRQRIPYTGDVVTYGGKVIDLVLDPELKLAPGDTTPTLPELLRLGAHAIELCQAGLVTQAAVDAASTFYEAPSEESNASSSLSNAGGADLLDGLPV